MGERITVVGGTDSTIAVTLDGAQAISLANQFAKELQDYYSVNQLNFLSVTETGSPAVENKIGYGVITQGGAAYTAGNGYDYIVVGGYNTKPPEMGMNQVAVNGLNLLNAPVTVNSVMNSSQYVRVLAGNLGGFQYNAAEESGALAAGSVNSNIVFNGNTVNGGAWSINTGKGDDTIVTGSGNNTVNADTGKNQINITAGNRNMVYSLGQDTITALRNSTAKNTVILQGGSSTVDINNGASVTDVSTYNSVTVGGGSTISGGTYGNYVFNGSSDSSLSTLTNGLENTVRATSDLLAVHGDSNTITAGKSLTLLNAIGNTSVTTQGLATAFGADGLNYTLNALGKNSGLFVADVGNETLNASGSEAALQVFANTVVGASSSFVAVGGQGNDTLVAGTGNSTFTGGAGDNLFQFSKETAENGNTVIKDFANNHSHNKIALFNYGLDSDSLAKLLQNSSNDTKGNAVLHLTGHTITIEGVSVADLTVNQFEVANASTTKSS